MNNYRRYILPLLILWLALGLRLYHLDFQSIWWDEGHSIFVATHAISQIPTLPAMDVHPPAYFTLLHLWMDLTGRSVFALRYLSVIFSLLTVALLWRFGASLSKQLLRRGSIWSGAGLASLLAALSPMYVAYAQEVRSYALVTFLALSSTFLLWRLLFLKPDSDGGRRATVIAYIVFTAACLYTHYFTIFLLLFQNLAWLGWVAAGRSSNVSEIRNARLRVWLLSQGGILLLFGPQLLLALRQVTSYTNPNLIPPSLSYFVSHSWQAYTVGLTLDPGLARWSGWGLGLILSGIWLIILVRSLNVTTGRSGAVKSQSPGGHSAYAKPLFSNFFFLLAWIVIPLLAYFFVLHRQPSFEPRYLILVTPALFLLLAWGLTLLSHALLYLFFSFLTVAILLTGLYGYYTDDRYFKDNSAGVASWLARETTADDIVYVDVPHPFHYYADQQAIPAPTSYLFVDIHTAARILTEEAAGKDRLFWVTWRGSDTDPRGVLPFLAEKFGQRLGQQDFRGYQVTWFDLPPKKTGFTLPTALPRVQATFGNVLRLDGAAYGGTPPQTNITLPGETVWATLHFTLLQDTDVDYRVSLRLRSETGSVVSQVDKDLLNDRHFRTSAWPVDNPALNQALNVYTLRLPPETAPGAYRLEVVVYNAQPPYPSEGVTGPLSIDGVAAQIGHMTVKSPSAKTENMLQCPCR